MADEYKSFYLKDLVQIINAAALECMMTPSFGNLKKIDGTSMSLAEISNYNSLIGIHNEGVRELAERLKGSLLRGEGDD